MSRNCNNKFDNVCSGPRVLRFGFCAFFAFACIAVISGCGKVTVAGRERNLVEHGRIRGEIELSAEVQESTSSGKGQGRNSKSVVFKERVRVKTKGDIYHPYLAAFSAAIGAGLTQQDVDSTGFSERSTGDLNEYDFSLNLLRGQSYPIDFYTRRSQNITVRQFLSPLKMENESSGVSFSIPVPKWPMYFDFSSNTARQDSLDSSEDTRGSDFLNRTENKFRYNVSHRFTPESNLEFDFNRNQNISEGIASKTERVQDSYRLLHSLNFGEDARHSLRSSFGFFETKNGTSRTNSRWTERLSLKHSDDLKSNHGFTYTEAESAGTKNTRTDLETGFTHYLYDSLTTSGRLNYSESKFGNISESKTQRKSLSFNYRKTNPFGLFSSSYSVALSNSEMSGGVGSVEIFDEVHAATSIPVVLDRRNVDIESIVLKDQFGDTYDEGSDYTITVSGDRVLIDLMVFGGSAPFFTVLDGTETFFVDYSYFVEPDREDDQLYQRYSVRQSFNNGLSIYYEHTSRDNDITSNVANVVPDESRDDVYGLSYRLGRFNLSGEYRLLDSTQIESVAKRLRSSYYWDINSSTRAKIHANWEKIDYTVPSVYESTNIRFGGDITSELNRRWDAVGGVNYFEDSDSRGTDSTGIQLSMALKYRYRQLRMSTGIDYNILDSANSQRDNSLIFFRVTRLF